MRGEGANKRHHCYRTHVREGGDVLQFSPTGSHSTEERVYAGRVYSSAKKHWSLSASDLNRDTKMHHRAIKEPHYQTQNSKPHKQHSLPHRSTHRSVEARKAPWGPGPLPAGTTSKGLLYSPGEAVQHYTCSNPELSSPSGIWQVLPFAH